MSDGSAPPTSRVATAVAILVTLPALVLGVGFIFHTCFDAAVFGKYTWTYLAFLIGWFVLVVPGIFMGARFVLSTQQVRLSGGRTALVRPLPKLFAVVILGIVVNNVVAWRVREYVAKWATTGRDVFHPYLQNHPAPDREWLHTNNQGYRGDPAHDRKPEGVCRVVVLGGSTVYCARLPYEQTHAYLLQERLRAAYPDRQIEVLNAGADWHTSQHSVMKFLFYIQDLDPDLVICYHAINDLCRSFVPDAFGEGLYKRDYGHYYGAATHLARDNSAWRLFRLRLDYWFSDYRAERVRVVMPTEGTNVVAKTLLFPRAEPRSVEQWRSLPAFRRNMEELAHAATRRGIPVVLASQPYLYREDLADEERSLIWFPLANQSGGTKPSMASMIEGMDRYNAVARRVARDAGLGFVDLATLVPRTTEYFRDDVHYTPAACEIIAEAFAEHVLDAGLLEQAPPER